MGVVSASALALGAATREQEACGHSWGVSEAAPQLTAPRPSLCCCQDPTGSWGEGTGEGKGGGPTCRVCSPAQRLVRPCSSPCTPPPRLLGQAEGTFLPPPVPPSAPRCCSRGRSCRKPPTHTGGRAARGCPGGSSQSPVSPPLREEGQVGGGPEADLLWCCGRQAQPPRTQRLDLRPNPSFEGSNPSLFFPRCPRQFGQWDGPSLGPHLLGGCPSLGRSLRPPPARAAPGDRGP